MSKKIFAAILAIVMVLGTLPVLPLFSSAATGDILDQGWLNDGKIYWQVVATNDAGTTAKLNVLGSGTFTAAPWKSHSGIVTEVNVYSVGGTLTSVASQSFNYFTKLQTVRIGEGVTSINGDAFANCGATGITFYFPSTLKSFGQGVIYNTTVKKFYFAGTEEQWGKITFGFYNDSLSGKNSWVAGNPACDLADHEFGVSADLSGLPTEIPSSTYPTWAGVKYESGMENWDGDTQILFGVDAAAGTETRTTFDGYRENRTNYKWVLAIDGIDYEMDAEDMSTFTAGSNAYVRFEPCNAENPFIPAKGVAYSVDLKIMDKSNDEILAFVTGASSKYTLNDYPIQFGEGYTPTTITTHFGDFEYWSDILYFYPGVQNSCWDAKYVDQSKLTFKVTDGNMVYSADGAVWRSTYGFGSGATDRTLLRIAPQDLGWTPALGKDYSQAPLKVEMLYDGMVIASCNFGGKNNAKGAQYSYALDVSCDENGTATVTYDKASGSYTLTVLTVADGYVFAGWLDNKTGAVVSSDISFVITPAKNDDLSYTATFEEPEASHTITWVVDGVETTTTVIEGEIPVYIGTPTKPAEGLVGYEFIGWDTELVEAFEDATYTAQFKKVPKPATQITWAVHSKGMENWENSPNNPNPGQQPGVTQFLLSPAYAYKELLWDKRADYTWDVTLTWTEDGETKTFVGHNWTPTTIYDGDTWMIMRFEPAMYDEYFDAQKDVKYSMSITLSQYNEEFEAMQAVYEIAVDGTLSIDIDPVVPERTKAGDIDGSGTLDISDVTALLNYLAADETGRNAMIAEKKVVKAVLDVNGDGEYTIADVTALLVILSEAEG